MMVISPDGRQRIKKYETLRLLTYLPTPQDVPTIGWGHTKGVRAGQTCTIAQAEQWLSEDCKTVEMCLNVSAPVVSQGQFDALGSLVFNVGVGGFLHSHLRQAILRGDMVDAKRNWLDWDHQGPVELLSLKRRRTEEWELFSKDIKT